jgi:hypothetical protein
MAASNKPSVHQLVRRLQYQTLVHHCLLSVELEVRETNWLKVELLFIIFILDRELKSKCRFGPW